MSLRRLLDVREPLEGEADSGTINDPDRDRVDEDDDDKDDGKE